ncbi:hypothetical protein ACN469_17075 [Corallococcus terminator]
MKRAGVVSKGLLAMLSLLFLMTACARQDPYVRNVTMVDAAQPGEALAAYERIIARGPANRAAFESRGRLAYVLADINRERARACARYVAVSDLPGLSVDAKAFLTRHPASGEEVTVSDQKLCDTSNRADREKAKVVEEQALARTQAAARTGRSGGASATQGSGSSSSTKGDGSGNCHWVNGYTRKNGTSVRGHMRCR